MWPCVPKNLLDFNSNIMVGYARHNIHFRKSCAHFKILHSVEILYCKLSPSRVHVCECVWVCVCVCFQNSNNSLLHNGQNRRVCMEMPMIICYELAIIEDGWSSYHFHETCWVHLEMPTMIIVACSWVSNIRNSVGNRL